MKTRHQQFVEVVYDVKYMVAVMLRRKPFCINDIDRIVPLNCFGCDRLIDQNTQTRGPKAPAAADEDMEAIEAIELVEECETADLDDTAAEGVVVALMLSARRWQLRWSSMDRCRGLGRRYCIPSIGSAWHPWADDVAWDGGGVMVAVKAEGGWGLDEVTEEFYGGHWLRH